MFFLFFQKNDQKSLNMYALKAQIIALGQGQNCKFGQKAHAYSKKQLKNFNKICERYFSVNFFEKLFQLSDTEFDYQIDSQLLNICNNYKTNPFLD